MWESTGGGSGKLQHILRSLVSKSAGEEQRFSFIAAARLLIFSSIYIELFLYERKSILHLKFRRLTLVPL